MLFVFEILIYSCLISFALISYLLLKVFLKSKKAKFFSLFFSLLFIFGFGVIFYGSFIEPRILKVKNYDIEINKTTADKKIKAAVVSDMHFGPFKKSGFSQKIADKINSQKPDIIFLLGDYIYGKEKYSEYLEPILKLNEKYPIYAITGNHEYHLSKYSSDTYKDKTKTLREILAKYNVPLLENESRLLNISGEEFYVAGLKEIWTAEDDLNKTILNTNNTKPHILLCHNPEIILKADSKVDLILSGHTHAGQIRLPYIGSVPNLPTSLGRHYDKGLFKFTDNQLFITPGAGEIGPRARLFNHPEVSILNINL